MGSKIPHIFVETGFRRTTQPIFLLAAMEDRRRIYIDKYDVLDSGDNGLSMAQQAVREHYRETNGTLQVWGRIRSYFYHANGKVYKLDTNGDLMYESDAGPENMKKGATLSFKGRELHIKQT